MTSAGSAWLLSGRLSAVCLAFWIVAGAAAWAEGPAPPRFRGLALGSALARLQASGMKIIFSTDLVRPEMIVLDEPRGRAPRAVLDELLEPHGLRVVRGSARTLLVVMRPLAPGRKGGPGAADAGADRRAGRRPPAYREEIVVRSSDPASASSRPEVVALVARRSLTASPDADRDPLAAAARFAGVAVAHGAGPLHVRGSARRDTKIVLDGLELYDPYHLKDRGAPLSLIDSQNLAGIALLSGPFPAEHGGALGAIVTMDTIEPGDEPHASVGVSTSELRVAGMASLGSRLQWLVSGRRGHPSRLLDALGADPRYRPAYSDLFGKLEYQADTRTRVTFHALSADEEVEGLGQDEVIETTRELGRFRARHASRYGWLTLTRSHGSRLVTATTASFGRMTLDRFGSNPRVAEVRDARTVSIFGVKHDWAWQSARHLTRWGVDFKQLAADYHYASTPLADATAGAEAGMAATRPSVIGRSPAGRDVAVYVSEGFRISRSFLVDVGVRGEQQTYGIRRAVTLGPRLNAVASVSDNTVVRIGWSQVSQPERIHELQVEDGVREFHPPERGEHRTLGVAHDFGRLAQARVSVYQTRVTDVNPRFENLFELPGFFPAASEDRVRVSADRARAEGIEVALSSRPRATLEWSAAYALARTEDQIGGSWVPRSWDQRHAIDATMVWRPGDRWDFTVAARAHSGWPITPIVRAVDQESGEWHTTIGQRNSRRLPASRRLDLRIGRKVTIHGPLPRSEARLSLTVSNVFNDGGRRHIDRGAGIDAAVTSVVGRHALQDLPRLVTLGVSWAF